MDKIMMWVMAICALIGGVDQLAGNKFGLGRRFEDGFQLLGPTALSMAGLICITPLLSLGLEHTVVPLYRILHLDPGMLGGVLAIDMGGYQLCKELAQDPAIGRYGGIIVGATLGCTITFTIPVGMGMLGEREKPLFAKGILAGLCMLPVGILTGGLMWCFSGKTAFSEHSGSDSCDSSGFWNFPVSGWNDPWVSDICNGDPQCGYYRNCVWSIFLYDGSAAASRPDSSG